MPIKMNWVGVKINIDMISAKYYVIPFNETNEISGIDLDKFDKYKKLGCGENFNR